MLKAPEVAGASGDKTMQIVSSSVITVRTQLGEGKISSVIYKTEVYHPWKSWDGLLHSGPPKHIKIWEKEEEAWERILKMWKKN